VKKSRFSEEQVVRILQEAESGKAIREVCRAHGVSEPTFYAWKRKYAGMETQDVRRRASFGTRSGYALPPSKTRHVKISEGISIVLSGSLKGGRPIARGVFSKGSFFAHTCARDATTQA